jgi:hypothetical protein
MSKDEDDGLQQLVSGEYADEGGFMDRAAAMVLEHMCKSGAAGPPVILQRALAGSGPGSGSRLWAYCNNQAAEGNSRRIKEQHKAEADGPAPFIPPIPELDHQRLISSNVASTCLSLPPTAHVAACSSVLDPPRCQHHPPKTTRRQVHLAISVFTSFATHSACCLVPPAGYL